MELIFCNAHMVNLYHLPGSLEYAFHHAIQAIIVASAYPYNACDLQPWHFVLCPQFLALCALSAIPGNGPSSPLTFLPQMGYFLLALCDNLVYKIQGVA